jgi:hypothetical protein
LILYSLFDFIFIKSSNFKTRIIAYIKNFIPIGVTFLLLNIYWLLGLVKVGSLQNNAYLSRDLFGSQYYNILYSLTLHHPWWSSVGVTVFQNQPIPFYFWIIPLCSFAALILNRKNKTVLFFGALSLLGILLSKQIDDPFPNFYSFLYNHFPGFSAFREASKFYTLVAISYSVLLSSFIDTLWKRKQSIINTILKSSFLILIVGIFLLNLQPFITGKIQTIFVPRQVPNDYLVFKNFILTQPTYSRILWVPKDPRWGIYTDLHSKISAIDLLQTNWSNLFDSSLSKLPQQNQITDIFHEPYSQFLLSISSVKYVVVPIQDVANDDDFFQDYGGRTDPNIREWYLNQLNNISFLKKINIGTNNLVVYENINFQAPIFSFNKLSNIDTLSNLDKKYFFINNELGNGFFFTLNNTNQTIPAVKISNIFENPSLQNISSENNLSTSTLNVSGSNNTDIYVANNYSEIQTQVLNNSLIIYDKKSGILNLNGSLINTSSSTQSSVIGKISINNSDYISYLGNFMPISHQMDLGIASSTENINVYSSQQNTIPNGSFEDGLWQKTVGDCNNFDSNGKLKMSLNISDKTNGNQSLELDAANHIACTSTSFAVNPGSYAFSFDYKSPNSQNAEYFISFNDPNKTYLKVNIPIQNQNWNTYLNQINVPLGATAATLSVYSLSTDGKNYNINLYDNFSLERLSLAMSFKTPNNTGFNEIPINLQKTNTIIYNDSNFTYKNLLPNGSFEDGLWQKTVGDCNNFDDNPIISMKLSQYDSIVGGKPLELEATRHTACTSKYIQVQGAKNYILSFNYQSPNAQLASYNISFNGTSSTSEISNTIPITNTSWHNFSTVFQVPQGSNNLSINVYAQSTNGTTNIINRYDNFKLIQVPNLVDAYYLVSQPSTPPLKQPTSVTFDLVNPTKKLVHIKGATTGFFLAMSEAWHPSWQLEMNNPKVHGILSSWTPLAHPDKVPDDEHFELDDFLNGWYVDVHQLCEVQHVSGCTKNADGSYNLEMEIEFWPQRWFYVGLVISGTTLAAVLGYLGYAGVQALRKRKNHRRDSVIEETV